MPGAILVASTLDAARRFAAGVVPLSSSAALLAEGVLRSMLLRKLQRLAAYVAAQAHPTRQAERKHDRRNADERESPIDPEPREADRLVLQHERER